MIGLTAIGAYVPQARLQRAAMAAAMGWLTPSLPAQGSRSMGFWDEDSTTMAVEAARAALASGGPNPKHLDLCTVTPPFAERQNAAIVHAALALPADVTTQEIGTTALAGLTALYRHLETGTGALIVCADRPVSAPGSMNEARMGDGAGCLRVGRDDPALAYLGGAALTDPFTDRYRVTGAQFATEWEERWIRDIGWQGLVRKTIGRALDAASIAASEVDHLIAASPLPRIGTQLAQSCGLTRATIADDLAEEIGFTATAHPALMIAAHLPQISPGQTVLITGLGQGATALVFRATKAVFNLATGLSGCTARARPETAYSKLHIFSGLLPWDPGQRGKTPVVEALTTADRYAPALLSFIGGRCRDTGTVQFPPSRISANRQAALVDTQEPWPLANRAGRVTTCTADRLAFSRNPPACYGLVDFDGGGRLMMDFTDVDATEITAGDTVRFVFRVKDIDANTGYRRYFWKAVSTPVATDKKQEADNAKRD